MSYNLSEAFKALGHPHRLAIVRRLIEQSLACDAGSKESCGLDPSCCDFGELVEELDVSKSTVSHHLKELHYAGLIERTREGRRLYCRINRERLEELRSFLTGRPEAAGVSS
jgi:ArsR family transcriptional regulator